MIDYTLRFIKRFAVLIPGIVIAYFSARDIFPLIDKRFPLEIAIFITYVISAYVLIPALIRLLRIILPPQHLPLYCVTPDGFASDPLNVGIIGSRRELIMAMTAAGWYLADRRNLTNTAKQVAKALARIPYPSAPMSSLFLFGRRQDVGFEIPLGKRGHRHHVRFWATTYSDNEKLTVRSIHWHKRREHLRASDNLLWIGAASLDEGLTLIRHNVQITHLVNPDTDNERELIVKKLQVADLAASVRRISLVRPYKLVNRGWRAHLRTDGQMAIIHLKKTGR